MNQVLFERALRQQNLSGFGKRRDLTVPSSRSPQFNLQCKRCFLGTARRIAVVPTADFVAPFTIKKRCVNKMFAINQRKIEMLKECAGPPLLQCLLET